MRGLGPFLVDAWRLAKPYFASSERLSAWALLIVIIAMSLVLVGMDVILNFWNGAFYDSLQNKDWKAFLELLFFYRPFTSSSRCTRPTCCNGCKSAGAAG
jgi:putative ATP-binding cassette transporter